MEYISEYDAFGPWIYEIDEGHEVPKIFRKYYNEYGRPLILFKVPRNIERRNASPDMDLYDYLLGAYDTYLCVLKREGGNVIENKIDYDDIFAIKDVHALIKGELIFFTENESIKIDYNTISEDIVLKLISIVEKKIINEDTQKIQTESIPIEYVPGSEDSLDLLFIKLLNTLKENNPAAKLAAYQPRIYIKGNSTELSEELSKVAFIVAENELIILKRETQKEDLYYSFLYIPLHSIKGIGISGFDRENLLYETQLVAGNQTFTYIVENRNKKIFELYQKLDKINQDR